MGKLWAAIGLVLVVAAGPAHAQAAKWLDLDDPRYRDHWIDMMRKCQEIADGTQRLSCVDDLTSRVRTWPDAGVRPSSALPAMAAPASAASPPPAPPAAAATADAPAASGPLTAAAPVAPPAPPPHHPPQARGWSIHALVPHLSRLPTEELLQLSAVAMTCQAAFEIGDSEAAWARADDCARAVQAYMVMDAPGPVLPGYVARIRGAAVAYAQRQPAADPTFDRQRDAGMQLVMVLRAALDEVPY